MSAFETPQTDKSESHIYSSLKINDTPQFGKYKW